MGMIKLASSGSWWLSCESDPKWNCNGHTPLAGGFLMPSECKSKLEELKKKFKEEPPKDLEWGYMKD